MKDVYKLFHRRNLPHIIPREIPLFITYHLDFQFPPELKQKLFEKKHNYAKQRKLSYREIFNFEFKIFEDFDNYLTSNKLLPKWLSNQELAQIVFDSLHYVNSKFYKLHCFCVMPNHVHVLLTLLNDDQDKPHSLPYIMQNHKRFTARECNKVLGLKGKFWHQEYFDHFCRSDKEFNSIIWYILNNPVKAKLAQKWQDYQFTWIEESLKDGII